MATGNRVDPYMAFRFRVVINQVIEGGFSEVSGLEVTIETEDYWEGGFNGFVHKFPKETKFANLILKRGLIDRSTLWTWHRDVVSGIVQPRNIDIVLFKNQSNEVARTWSFQDAFPVKWSGPDLKADSNAVAFETLELVHHGFQSYIS